MSAVDDSRHGLLRPNPPLRSGCLLGTRHRRFDHESDADHRRSSGSPDARRTDHRGRDVEPIFRPSRFRVASNDARLRRSPRLARSQARHQRVADSRSSGSPRNLSEGISRLNASRRHPLRPSSDLERRDVRRRNHLRRRFLRGGFRPIRSDGHARSNDHPNRSTTRFLLPVDLQRAGLPSSQRRNSAHLYRAGDWTRHIIRSAIHCRRGREELVSPSCRRPYADGCRRRIGDAHQSRHIRSVESAHDRVDRRRNSRSLHPR